MSVTSPSRPAVVAGGSILETVSAASTNACHGSRAAPARTASPLGPTSRAQLALPAPGHLARAAGAPRTGYAQVLERPLLHAIVISVGGGPGAPRPAAGYASSSAALQSGGSATAASSGKSSSSRGEFAFLDDPHMSIEDKLFTFMQKMQLKSDDELEKKMKELSGAKTSTSSSSSSGAPGASAGATSAPGAAAATYAASGAQSLGDALFGFAKTLFPPLGLAEQFIGKDKLGGMLGDVVKQVSGPLLAAAATAVGFPELAPIALKLGPELVDSAGQLLSSTPGLVAASASGSSGALLSVGSPGSTLQATPAASSAAASSSGSSGSATASNGAPDQRLEYFELQRMVEKQNQMYSTISNMLKALNDTAMTAINNIR